jgi:cell division protein FtsW (lipid II flippase)
MNFKHRILKEVKSHLLIVVGVMLVTLLVFYSSVSENTTPKDSETDIFRFSFIFAIIWCLTGWLGCVIVEKTDDKTAGQEEKLCAIVLLGSIFFLIAIFQYFKQKKRAKYTPKELLGRKKDIYDLLEWFFK